jgi:hypothetical protein
MVHSDIEFTDVLNEAFLEDADRDVWAGIYTFLFIYEY